jgi:hypothetical protein
MVESLDDFAELVLHVHRDRLKKLSERLAFSSRTRFGTTTALSSHVLVLPNWGYHSYGFAPSGIAGVVLLVVVVPFLTGRL